MSSIASDVRYALRRARRRIGFTAVAVISLGIGIGANTAAFTLVDAAMLRKTPIASPDRVVELYVGRAGAMSIPLSYPDYRDLRAQTRDLYSMVSVSRIEVVPHDLGDRIETMVGEAVNGDFFPLVGLRPALGRLLGPEDDIALGAHPVVVLSHEYWQRAFSGRADVIGKPMRLAGREYTIVGVAPEPLTGVLPGLAPSIFTSMQMINELAPAVAGALTNRGDHSLFASARLLPGVTALQARQRAHQFAIDMSGRYPSYWPAGKDLLVIPATSVAVNPMFDRFIVPAASVLLIVVALVLVIACTNLAGFLLAQAQDRKREIALRFAIGASRGAVIRQLLIESLVLAVLGGILGITLAIASLRAVLSAPLPVALPVSLHVTADARVLIFTLLASVVATLLFGLLPAIQGTRVDIIDAIKGGATGTNPRRRLIMRRALLVAQTAVSLSLLIAASLLLRSFAAQTSIDPGFGKGPAGLVTIAVPVDRYPASSQLLLLGRIEQRVGAMPGVTAVGVVDNLPLNPLSHVTSLINVAGFRPPAGETGFEIDVASADSGFFDAAGIRLLSGRAFSRSDVEGGPRVAVINAAMARKFWPGAAAVGKTFKRDTTTYQVVGVVANIKIHSMAEVAQPMIFGAFSQALPRMYTVVAQTRDDAAVTTTRMLGAMHDVEQSLMIVQAKTMAQHLTVVTLPARFGGLAVGMFAGLALILAMTGVYGIVRYAVANRRREVAIRLSVGASPRSVVRLLMSEGLTFVVAGVVVGLIIGVASSLALRSLLYGLPLVDPVAFVAAPMLLLAIGFAAALLPALGARLIQPAEALRGE